MIYYSLAFVYTFTDGNFIGNNTYYDTWLFKTKQRAEEQAINRWSVLKAEDNHLIRFFTVSHLVFDDVYG